MTQVLFDTRSAVDDLKRGGFTDDQAKANVRFVREALEGGVATKTDIDLLRSAISKDVTNVRTDLSTVETELRNETSLLKTELRGEMQELRAEMKAQGLRLTITILGASGLLGLLIRYLA